MTHVVIEDCIAGREYARVWPNIAEKGMPPASARALDGVRNKLRDLFSERPGEGS
jgi:ferredoxin